MGTKFKGQKSKFVNSSKKLETPDQLQKRLEEENIAHMNNGAKACVNNVRQMYRR